MGQSGAGNVYDLRSMVLRTLIRPPASRLGPITAAERQRLIQESQVAGQYDQVIDRESAFEMLQKKAKEAQDAEEQAQPTGSGGSRWTIPGFGNDDPAPQQGGRRAPAPRPSALICRETFDPLAEGQGAAVDPSHGTDHQS